MSNELSELQAVDFAVGEFITKAFDNLSLTTGPKEWKEFLNRDTSAQVYRHDAASPGEFFKALQASRKNETGLANNRLNAPHLPAVYYFRKNGFTNVNDRSKMIQGRYSWSEDLSNAYNIKVLQLDLDYTFVFVAWDKPTLDKMCMAWYAYIVKNDTCTAKFQIGADIMEVPVIVHDHCNLMISDCSEPSENGRLFAAQTNYTVHTMLLFGSQIPAPGMEYLLGYGDGVTIVFTWAGYDPDTTYGRIYLYIDGVAIAFWDGTQWISLDAAYTVTGDFPDAIIQPPPPAGSKITLGIDNIKISYGLGANEKIKYVMGYGDGATTTFGWNGIEELGKNISIIGGSVCINGEVIATLWTGTSFAAVAPPYSVTGTMSYDPASIAVEIIPAPASGATVEFCTVTGESIIGSGCPACHLYERV